MTKFVEKPATLQSISSRRLVHGVGINDADYITSPKINGKTSMCPFYRKWQHMMERGYCAKLKTRHPTYKDCSVTEEWHKFSRFKKWMKEQDWIGKHLDKDLLFDNNKIYAPDRCLFVSRRVNAFLTDRGALRGEWPLGVTFDKNSGKYRARVHNGTGKIVHIGRFKTPEDAHLAWRKEKAKIAIDIAIGEDDERVSDAMIAISKRLMGH